MSNKKFFTFAALVLALAVASTGTIDSDKEKAKKGNPEESNMEKSIVSGEADKAKK